jgi:hypothetical protein
MDYNTLMHQIEASTQEDLIDPHSLYAAFQRITDGRKKRGVRYPLPLLLTLIVLAKCAGQVTMSGVVDWVRLRHNWLESIFGCSFTRLPCFSTYTYALRKLNMAECTMVLSDTLTRLEASRRCDQEASRLLTQEGRKHTRHVAFDGKALRGTNGHEASHQPRVHLCAFYEVSTGNILAQREVREKENEISAVKEMLTASIVAGRIITLNPTNWVNEPENENGAFDALWCGHDSGLFHEESSLPGEASRPTMAQPKEPPSSCACLGGSGPPLALGGPVAL